MGEVKELQDKIENTWRKERQGNWKTGSTLESIVKKVYELKLRVQELCLENDNSLEDVRS